MESIFLFDLGDMMILRRKRSRRSLSLVEVIIASIILILVLSTMTFGFIRYHREAAVKTARKEVSILLKQADYLSQVTQQNLTVLIRREGDAWCFFLKPWRATPDARLPTRQVTLSGISAVSLNDHEVESLKFYFVPFKGIELSSFEVIDGCGRTLGSGKLGLSVNKDIIVHMKNKDPRHSCYIDLTKYIPRFAHEPLPEDIS